MKLAFAVLVLLTLAGCRYAKLTDENGNTTEGYSFFGEAPDLTQDAGQNDPNPEASKTPSRGQGGSVSATQPSKHTNQHAGTVAKTAAELANDRATGLMLAGIALCLVGVGLWVAKAYIPIVPTTAGTAAMLLGGALIVASFVLPSVPWWVWMIGLAVAAAFVIPSWIANHKDAQKTVALKKAAGIHPAASVILTKGV